jgi:hypothetical protein
MPNGQMDFYKKSGALQIQIIDPKFNAKGFLEKTGAVLVTLGPGDPDNKTAETPTYMWDKKVTFALGQPDLTAIIWGPECKLFHKTPNGNKSLSIAPGKDSGWQVALSGVNKDERGFVFLSDNEMESLRFILREAFPRILGFSA